MDDTPIVLPSSTCELYTDGSFLDLFSGNSPSMSSAWLALDDDNLILKSFSEIIPSTYPSSLRSETFALLSALKALASHSSTIINTDYAPLISTWNQFIDKPFLPKLLCQPNHLLWLSIRHQIHNKHLLITLWKVPAHADDMYNNQVDLLAKDALYLSQPSITPMALLDVLCIILYDSLPVDENIHHFFKSIYEARNLLDFCSLSRFSYFAPVETFDWEVLLDMLPTLTTLQKRNPSLYPSDWLCSLCHSASEDMNHLWTCPYIIPDASPRSIYHKLILSFHDACITNFSESVSLSDSFLLEFSALDCWDFTTPSPSCFWLTRGLFPVDLIQHLCQKLSKKKIFEVLTSLLSNLHEQLYWDIWMSCNIFFHLWLQSQTSDFTNNHSSPFSHSSSSPPATFGSS
ncbi:hypothetical protein RhiirC2_799344 [Rhizophagus irregularis]|uniref:RNase H type-1 domain-containing protein n=1 Tax=Rhizophagus irregularis TaxID=588596 RepID=A0A2N1M535_9GLOM|nr:hypothetical protein RhiirC2_799344 [Rhizophagus irregularis]